MKTKYLNKAFLLSVFAIVFYTYANAQQTGGPPSEMKVSSTDLHKRINAPLSEMVSELKHKDSTLIFKDGGKINGKPVLLANGSNNYTIEIIGTENDITKATSTIIVPNTLDAWKIEANRPALFVLIATGKLGIDWYYKQLLLLKSQSEAYNSSAIIYSLTKLNLDYDPTSRALRLTITSL